MSVLHRIQIPRRKQPKPIPSPIGQWESAADEVHEFREPMVQLTVSIDDDHTLHMFCEASQVERVPGVLRGLLYRAGAEEVAGILDNSAAHLGSLTLAMLDELVDAVDAVDAMKGR
jgi:hypothetical protein